MSASHPTGWVETTLAEVADFSAGRTPSRSRPDYWTGDESGVPWVAISDMRPHETVRVTSERISPSAFAVVFGGRCSPAGTLLMSFKLTIGRIAKLGVDACHNEAIISIRPKGIDKDFLGYYLSQVDYAEYQDRAIKGQTLNQDKLRRIRILVPPPDEQSRIAGVLSLVRRAIENEARATATARQLKQAAMDELFAGPMGRASADGKQKEPRGQWERSTIGEKFAVVAGGTPSRDRPEFWQAGTIPWVKTGEVDYCVVSETEEKITQLGLECSAAKILPRGTVLLAMYGQGVTRGKAAILGIDSAANQACVGLLPKAHDVLPRFLYQYLAYSYDALRSLSHGANQQNLNAELIRGFPLPVPGLPEQQRVAEILDAIDAKVTVTEKARNEKQELFGRLLGQLMTGALRVDELVLDINLSSVAA